MYNKISKIISNKHNVAVRPSMHVTIEVTEENEFNHINTIFVSERNRSQGIAKEIIKLIEEETKNQGKFEITLDAFPYSDNQGNTIASISKLVNWYKSLGYRLNNEFDYEIFLENSDKNKLYGFEDVPKGCLTMYKEV